MGRQLALTSKAVRAEFDQRLTEAGGSLTTWIVLRSAGGDGLSQRELAARMGVEGPTLVRHLDRLEREGLIQRRPDTGDRRVTRILVTGRGQALLARLALVAGALEAQLRDLLGDREYDETLRSLKRVHEHMAVLAGERKQHGHGAN